MGERKRAVPLRWELKMKVAPAFSRYTGGVKAGGYSLVFSERLRA